jgi:myo-inositol-1(or 4)-monophosphatase
MIDKVFAEQVVAICREAGAFIQSARGQVLETDIIEKGHNSLVSYVDTGSEKILVERLKALLPGSTFLTEEHTVEQSAGEHRWIIDPLDGTTNFLHQIPVFAVSVALEFSGKIVLGVVYEVNRDEAFYAVKGQGAYLDGHSIRVRNAPFSQALIATGFPYYDYTKTEHYLQALGAFMEKCRGVRRLGAAAVDLAYVACGRFDGFFEYSLAPWDVAAGALIVNEAGGFVEDFNRSDDWLFGRSIVAGSMAVHAEMQAVICSYFKNSTF